MYHNHKRISKALLKALGGINDETAKEADFLRLLNEGAETDEKQWRKV